MFRPSSAQVPVSSYGLGESKRDGHAYAKLAMDRMLRLRPARALCWAPPDRARAQTFEAVGTRAAGMGGAFVAVADDASAAYWNPAGFAAGNIFTMVLDRSSSEADPAVPDGARKPLGFLIAAGHAGAGAVLLPADARSRLPCWPTRRAASAWEPCASTRSLPIISGATLVQSIVHRRRGRRHPEGGPWNGTASVLVAAGDPRDDRCSTGRPSLEGRQPPSSTPISASWRPPRSSRSGSRSETSSSREFDAPAGNTLTLSRQARAGVAVRCCHGLGGGSRLRPDRRTTGPLGDEPAIRHRHRGADRPESLGPWRFAAQHGRARRTGRPPVGGSYRVMNAVFLDGRAGHRRGRPRRIAGWGIAAAFCLLKSPRQSA